MCGIIGLVGDIPVTRHLLEALTRLEYRGYDSSGIALFEQGVMVRYRTKGTLHELKKKVPLSLSSTIGIGHTRWATHGVPDESNAHPHFSQNIALVHNGILEGYSTFKKHLLSKGYEFESETDTEVLTHLFDEAYNQAEGDLKSAVLRVLPQLKGNFAIAFLIKDRPDLMVVARHGSCPLVIGYGENQHSVSSDALGLVGIHSKLSYLEQDHWAILEKDRVQVFDFQGSSKTLEQKENPFVSFSTDRGAFEHFMLKEMHEQPRILQHLGQQCWKSLPELLGQSPKSVTILGCGTSYYAGWVAKYSLEKYLNVPVTLELASEFHLRRPVMTEGVTLILSQSGETADTLIAAEVAKSKGQILVSLVNVPYSSIARLSDIVLDTQAGPEIGVASTKSFVAQLWILNALAGAIPPPNLSQLMEQIFLLVPRIQAISKELALCQSMLYLGRGSSYPLALEGALKMKELAYIHAEGLALGELKHGSIALIDEHLPVIALAPQGPLFEKTLANLHEIMAREGWLIVITDSPTQTLGLSSLREVLTLPVSCEIAQPFLMTLVLQLLAYYTAYYRGCTIDKPRNLAKSVTVE
jgi:glucosamine--fructose-6-phosphate aminotransferase (isomerizing)